MDKFTRNYSIILGLIVLSILGYWTIKFDSRVGELNKLLKNDPILSDYPYQFRIKSLKNGVAHLTTPRSFEMPAIKFLAIIYPELKDKSTEDPALISAQKDLARHQMRAKKLILDQPDVTKVQWVLDREWYNNRGVFLQ